MTQDTSPPRQFALPSGALDELRNTTFEILRARAGQSNIPLEKLGLRPEKYTQNTAFFVIWFDGFEDETFCANTLYEVNIADWLAEECVREADEQFVTDWRIEVRRLGALMEIHYEVDADTYGFASPGEQRCDEEASVRPHWMGVDQYSPCLCVLAKGHEPPCACVHALK